MPINASWSILLLPPNSIPARGTLYGATGAKPTSWLVPEEIPIALMINSQNYAVMMATPADLTAFAFGFMLAEGLVASAKEINRVLILPTEEGYALDVAVDPKNLHSERLVKRNLEGRTGCGLCGIADIRHSLRLPDRSVPAPALDPQAVKRAYHKLPEFQPMNALNRTVHAAAWCSLKGDILQVREDVGRHNALDKLIGELALAQTDVAQGFVLMSSRCSFELVQKCAYVGIGGLATISAPTALALKLARNAGVKLAALAQGGVMIFDQTSVQEKKMDKVPDSKKDEPKDIIRMANQIAAFFAGYGQQEAITEISGHINNFWNPRMRHHLLDYVSGNGAGLNPLVLEAVPLIRRAKA